MAQAASNLRPLQSADVCCRRDVVRLGGEQPKAGAGADGYRQQGGE